MKRSEFVEYILGDQLAGLPGMRARAMFGGFGVYKEDTIVGIVVDDELYLKVDESNKSEYEAMGSTPFVYEKKDGKKMTMSYWKIPGEVLEDRARLEKLVSDAYEINRTRSLRLKHKKKKPAKAGGSRCYYDTFCLTKKYVSVLYVSSSPSISVVPMCGFP